MDYADTMFKYLSGNKNRSLACIAAQRTWDDTISLPCSAAACNTVKIFQTHASSSYPVLFLVAIAQEVNYNK